MLNASRFLSVMSGHSVSLVFRPLAALVIGLGGACGSAYASQEAIDEVAKLVEQGKVAQASKQADSYLKQNPGNIQMRFLQGVIAAEQKKNSQAIKVFTALTQDYPNLPEPYNNLAVLYAAEGKERKASEILELAIRTNPSYATAHENLGDLYARMASEAYSKALQLDGRRQAIQPKLALITQIFPQPEAVSKIAEVKGAAGSVLPVRPTKVDEAKLLSSASPLPATPTASRVRGGEVASQIINIEDTRARVPLEVKTEIKPAAADKASQSQKNQSSKRVEPDVITATKQSVDVKDSKDVSVQAVEKAVASWAAAWAGQDLDRYLGAYSDHFTPSDGTSLAKWKEIRRQRIVSKSAITVVILDTVVRIDGDTATAKFRQNYAADSLKTTTKKTLKFQYENGYWRIINEATGA